VIATPSSQVNGTGDRAGGAETGSFVCSIRTGIHPGVVHPRTAIP